MKIIAIEGLDKSGKHTASEVLSDYLKVLGYKVKTSEFHRYDTPTGQLIRKYLIGEYNVSKETIELIMLADKYAQQETFAQYEKDGVDFLILDRYIDSQLNYSKAVYFKETSKEEMESDSVPFYKYIEEGIKGLRQPDYVFYLEVKPETSMARKGQHGENDRYESDKELLTIVHDMYLASMAINDHWHYVDSEIPAEQMIGRVLLLAKRLFEGQANE